MEDSWEDNWDDSRVLNNAAGFQPFNAGEYYMHVVCLFQAGG